MGALQPGLPSPVMIPTGFAIVIIDYKIGSLLSHYIKMTRKNLPLHCHPLIMKNQLNISEKCYLNSPTICQAYVHATLIPFYKK
jgi:hypothetical protein